METSRQLLAQASDNSHRLEECSFIEPDFVPVLPAPEESRSGRLRSTGRTRAACDFLVAIGLSGSTRWRLVPGSTGVGCRSSAGSGGGHGLPPAACECVLDAGRFAAFGVVPGLHVARTGERTAHLLLWRFRLDTIHAMLGHPISTDAATDGYEHPGGPLPVDTWPVLGPAPVSPELRSLVLALRTAQHGLMQDVWYGAKLLELLTLIHPKDVPQGASCPVVGPFEEGDGTPSGGIRGLGGGRVAAQTGGAGGRLHPAVERAIVYIRNHYTEAVSLPEIASAAGVSPAYLSHLFARQFGEKLGVYLRRTRLEHAARLLESGDCNVTEAAMAVGYNSLAQFNHTFRALFGYPPGEHRRRRQAETSLR